MDNQLTINETEFELCLNQQKQRSKDDAAKEVGDWTILSEDDVQEFIGYEHTSSKIRITKYRTVETKGEKCYQLIFSLTPFYAEGGGQVGDTGLIYNQQEKLKIVDTKKENGVIIHFVNKLPDNLIAEFIAEVDKERRDLVVKNHTATHLLHYALREVLGTHVEQRGSLVNDEYLRFDFSHFSKVSKDEITTIESFVNERIRESIPLIEERNVPLDIAKNKGAMMLFGEKYSDTVRVIQFGDSIELCGWQGCIQRNGSNC